MSAKRKVTFVIIFIITCMITSYPIITKGFKNYSNKNETKIITDNTNIKESDVNNKLKEEDTVKEETKENNEIKVSEEINDTTNLENVSPKENKTETKEAQSKTNNTTTDNVDIKVDSNKSVDTTSKTAWEELGISESDYYNKPMWSWARVDYSIKEYGSYEKAHQSCIDAGNNLTDIISFSCTSINSYSGDYLGEMLRVKK